MIQATMPRPQGAGDFTRYGTIAMRIGALMNLKLTKALSLKSGRLLKAGQTVHVAVEDITRHPETDSHTKWVCRHPECAEKTWDSKKALLAAHKNERELKSLQETHCYHAVAYMPAIEGKDAVIDKRGEVTSEAVEASPGTVIVMSDEE